MLARFSLLGKSDCENPASITHTQIAQWQAQGIIEYFGECEDVRPYIESASCIVLPSFYKEGVPRVLLEAMSMGKAIITTYMSGCKECIAPPLRARGSLLLGQNGILIPPKDTDALIEAIKLLMRSPKLLDSMGKAGRTMVKKRFSIDRIIHAYHTHTQALLGSHPDPKQMPQTLGKRIQILAFISNTSFGMYNFRLKVLQSLANKGFAIHIIAPFDTTTPKLQSEGFITHPLHIDSRSLNPLKDLRTLLHLRKILKSIKPQLVFNYTIKPAIYSSWICNRLKIPNIAIITGLGYAFIKGGIKKKILLLAVCLLYKLALKQTQEVWFLNPDDKDEFITHHLIQQHQAFVLNSEGVDTQHFSPPATPQILNPIDTPATPQEIRFLLIARMLWDKGVGEFVQAATILKQNTESDLENLGLDSDIQRNTGGGTN